MEFFVVSNANERNEHNIESKFCLQTNYFLLFFLQNYFFDEQSKFLILQFIKTKSLNIDLFMNEN